MARRFYVGFQFDTDEEYLTRDSLCDAVLDLVDGISGSTRVSVDVDVEDRG